MRWRRPGALAIPLLVLGATVLAAAPSAWAHVGTVGSASVVAQAQQLPDGAWPWAALLALAALALPLRVPRRVAAVALVVLLAAVAFETGVHAVHHLGDARAAARCTLASAASHLGDTTVAAAACTPALEVSADRASSGTPFVLVARALSPSPGRAPPVF